MRWSARRPSRRAGCRRRRSSKADATAAVFSTTICQVNGSSMRASVGVVDRGLRERQLGEVDLDGGGVAEDRTAGGGAVVAVGRNIARADPGAGRRRQRVVDGARRRCWSDPGSRPGRRRHRHGHRGRGSATRRRRRSPPGSVQVMVRVPSTQVPVEPDAPVMVAPSPATAPAGRDERFVAHREHVGDRWCRRRPGCRCW